MVGCYVMGVTIHYEGQLIMRMAAAQFEQHL